MSDSVSMFSAKEPGIEKRLIAKYCCEAKGRKFFLKNCSSNISRKILTTNMGVTESWKKLSIIYGIIAILIIYALLLTQL